jgi:hypothetical protein
MATGCAGSADLVVLFNDSFFMASMFFISGLFVRGSPARRRSANFLGYAD